MPAEGEIRGQISALSRLLARLKSIMVDGSKIITLSNLLQNNESPGPFCGRKIQMANRAEDRATIVWGALSLLSSQAPVPVATIDISVSA